MKKRRTLAKINSFRWGDPSGSGTLVEAAVERQIPPFFLGFSRFYFKKRRQFTDFSTISILDRDFRKSRLTIDGA
jgi:hypothetical protein